MAIHNQLFPRFGIRELLLASSALVILAVPAAAQNASWLATPVTAGTLPGTFNFNSIFNWSSSPGPVPVGSAFFGASTGTAITFTSIPTMVGDFTFGSGAPDYSFTLATAALELDFTGAGIVSNGSRVTINNFSSVGKVVFFNTSSAGAAFITNTGVGDAIIFHDGSTAGNANITNNSEMVFFESSRAGTATITNNANLDFQDHSTADAATIVTNSGGTTLLTGSANGGTARFILNGTGSLDISGLSGGGTSAGSIEGDGNVSIGVKSLAVGGNNLSTTFTGVIADGGAGGSLTKEGAGTLTLSGHNTYTGATTVSGGTLAAGAVNAFSTVSATTIGSGGTLDFGGFAQTVNAINLTGGTIRNGPLTGAITSNGGTINDLGGTASLTTTGGITTIAGSNGYTGATTINGGKLQVDGTITGTSNVAVNSGGVLAGIGNVDPLTVSINTGGTLAPGNGAAGTSLTISGNLAFQSGAQYLVQINPVAASFANVSGTATLGGATLNAIFANGGYISKQYTILTAGNVSGTFGGIANTNLPSGFSSTLSYDGTHAFLNLSLIFGAPSGPANNGINRNQQNVGNALTNFFDSTGSIPAVFGALTPAGLTQASGETAVGSQQTTFNAMNLFMGVLTDPFIDGRGGLGMPGAAATPFAEGTDGVSAYAANGKPRSNSERDAYAMFTKAPPASTYEPRWSVWAAGFGGAQSTGGNTALGSNDTTSHIFGTAVGADYLFSPQTIAGFALAGGGTNFSVANGGSGRSDLFQAGGFVRHNAGAAYVSGALAYGWQDVTTDRTTMIAGIDRLRAAFNANAWSGRVEGGYRYVTPWLGGIGLTPYAAGQFTTFELPAYAESVVSGANTFALAYNAKSATATRSELGFRSDKSFAMPDGIFTLRGRAAWAHDYNTDRNIAATFQTLPGASFVVNGAASAADAALVTASAERKWLNGFSLAATFEGEFSNVTRSYAGKGVVRYQW